jgi:hypothetical protein
MAPAQRGPFLLFTGDREGKIQRTANIKRAAIKLLDPAMTTGCQCTSFIKSPLVLHKKAHSSIAPWPCQRDCSLRVIIKTLSCLKRLVRPSLPLYDKKRRVYED